jgi:uncharacterized protein
MTTCTTTLHHLPEAAVGTARTLLSLHFGPKGCGRKAYVQAGLHADEAPGYVVVARLLEMLHQADRAGEILGEIVVVPAANPIGLSQWGVDTVRGRFDDIGLINFNRRYLELSSELSRRLEGRLGGDAAANVALIRRSAAEILAENRPESEVEALKRLLLSLSHDADIVLDVHCDHQALLHVYLGESLWPEAMDLPAQLGATVTLLADDSGDLPFDEANSKLWWDLAKTFPEAAIPPSCLAATIELRGLVDTEQPLAASDAANLFAFLQRRGFLAGNPLPLPSLQAEATPLAGVDYIKSPAAGILSYVKSPGDRVEKGETVALLLQPLQNPGGGERLPIASVTSGIFFARAADRFARPGKIIGKVAGSKLLADKGANLLTS